MVAALHAMAGIDDVDPAYGAFARMADDEVMPMWTALTANAGGQSDPPSDAELRRLQKLSEEVVALLVTHTPARLRCQLGPQYKLYQALASPPASAAPNGATIVRVLDAAWRWRSHNIAADDATLTRVGDNALRWCAAAAQGFDDG
jgi:hypothetical protein